MMKRKSDKNRNKRRCLISLVKWSIQGGSSRFLEAKSITKSQEEDNKTPVSSLAPRDPGACWHCGAATGKKQKMGPRQEQAGYGTALVSGGIQRN